MLQIACSKCGRTGRLSIAGLIAKHRPGMKLPDLRHAVAECPRTRPDRRPVTETDACGVEFPELRR